MTMADTTQNAVWGLEPPTQQTMIEREGKLDNALTPFAYLHNWTGELSAL